MVEGGGLKQLQLMEVSLPDIDLHLTWDELTLLEALQPVGGRMKYVCTWMTGCMDEGGGEGGG